MSDISKDVEANNRSVLLKNVIVPLERLLPSQITQLTQDNSNDFTTSTPKRRNQCNFGSIKDIDVGSRFETKYIMKVKGLHLSERNIHNVKLGVLSLIVSPKHHDCGDTISISIQEKKHKAKNSEKGNDISNSFYENFKSCLPIRVIRGAIGGQYAPLKGYRYDGLYRVENAWDEFCKDTTTIYHNFDLIRQRGQTVVYEEPPLSLPLWQPSSNIQIKSVESMH